MKNSFIKSVTLLTLLLILGVGQLWAAAGLKGSWDSWTYHDISGGSCEVTLPANTEYEFVIDVDGKGYSYTNQHFTTTSTNFQIYKDNGNCKITTGEAGTYIFKTWYDNGRYMAVYYPQARLTKQKYIYFDARNQTNWNSGDFDARFWFKYYDSGSDNGSVDCNKGSALENWVYYALVPDHDYIGQIQMNRLNPSDHNQVWCAADKAYAKDRTSSAQNCLKEESGKADYCNSWTPQWTTYCPPMSSVTLADNGTTNWGGTGGSSTPYLVPTGGDIKVHVTASASALDDANMTKYFLFKKEGSAVGEGSDATSKTITASSTTGTKEAVIVEAYNYYNSTEGTHLASSAIYYEARTPYTISYNAGTGGSGSRASETKLKGVNFTLPNSAVFTRTGYTQTGWTTSNLGAQTHAFGASYTGDANQTFYPAWTPKNYTINLANMDATTPGDASVTVTFDASTNMTSPINRPAKTHYDFAGYWTSRNTGTTLDTLVIDANGNWIKDVQYFTGHSGDNPTWIHDYAITLYAKWTEHEYNITINVVGSGSTSPASSTKAKYVTASGDITATPSTGYSFRDWDFSITGGNNDVYSADGYTSLSNPIHILAQHDGTLTANFIANDYTVQLENQGATSAGTENVSVTYDASTNLTTSIICPTKTNYDFGGYFTAAEGAGTQLINSDGSWIADVTGYTGASKEWVYANNITLYAKWTETAYTITPSVSPAGAGSVNTVTDAHLVTPSSTITATPANAAWTFDYWEYGTNVGYASGSGNAITVTASQNSTITAHFKPRFSLVGSLYEGGNGGMPGWEDYTKTFIVNSTSPMDLTRSCTLQANQTYKVQVHDNATGTNLGRSGCDPVCVLEENASLVMENSNNDVFLYTSGAGEYIFKITAIDGSDHPTLTVLRPYPVNFGQKYLDIDGTLHAGTTGGTATASASGALSSGDYVTYNTSVTHTATSASGYTFAGWWSSDAFEGGYYSNVNPMTYSVTAVDNAYAKFVETSTSLTLANDGHGKVQIGGADATITTCGVTTTRELTAVAKEGYQFSSWSTSGDDISLTNTSTNPTTLRGLGTGAASGQTVTANFTECWALSAQTEGWGSTEFIIRNITVTDGKSIGYVDIPLPANTNLQFKMLDKSSSTYYYNGEDKIYYMTYDGNHTDWAFATNKTYNCGITTAGKGTYRFTWNITDKTMTVTYPTSYQVNFGASVGGSVTSVVDGDGNAVPNGGYVIAGGSVTYTAAANSGYTFESWCGSDSYNNPFNYDLSWTHNPVNATSNSYAKFKSTNFIIYRTGDMSEDPRAALDDVESYNGGTVSETIEFRMKVRAKDYWYSLCLPFTVNAVQVWDEADGEYYAITPYWRTGGKYYTGYYIIRTPNQTTNFPIADFGNWNDPESPTGYLPSANTPYIIQWHDNYFVGKYISFFGATGQNISGDFSAGSAPTSDDVVNVYGNNTMKSGTVRDAYLLEADYGSSGAWLRAESTGVDRTVLPFECFIRASSATTQRYRRIYRNMDTQDTPTGWEDVINSENKTHVAVYTLTGIFIGQYDNSSFNEVAQRLSTELNEGIYILRSDNESVKLLLGGK